MTIRKLIFFVLIISVGGHSHAQNQLNSRLFYSKPPLYNSKSKVTHVNFAGYHVTVSMPTDDRSKFYGEEVYKNVTTREFEEFFESPIVVEIQNKMNADFKKLGQGRTRSQNELVINPSLEVFYPKVHGLAKPRSFAKVRLNISTQLNGVTIFHQKYESLYITNGMDNGFEGDVTMTMEQGENVTGGMALRMALDQFYTDLHGILKLDDQKIILEGLIVNAKTKAPVSAPFSFQTDSVFSATSLANGKIRITLPKANGKVQIVTPNFMPYTEPIDFAAIGMKMVVREFKLQPIESGAVVTIQNVLFYMGTANLLESSYDELDAVVAFLKSNPRVKIELNGHTDNQGDAHKDLILSQDRVERIKNYLVSKKINPRRVSGKGFGGTKPLASNATEEGRKLNRRVEFVILKH